MESEDAMGGHIARGLRSWQGVGSLAAKEPLHEPAGRSLARQERALGIVVVCSVGSDTPSALAAPANVPPERL
jgi:hypothetical protein